MKKKTLICTLCAGLLILAVAGKSLVFASSQAQNKTGEKVEQEAVLNATEEEETDRTVRPMQKADNGEQNVDKNTLEAESESKPTLQEINVDSAGETKALNEQTEGKELVQTIEEEAINEAKATEQ